MCVDKEEYPRLRPETVRIERVGCERSARRQGGTGREIGRAQDFATESQRESGVKPEENRLLRTEGPHGRPSNSDVTLKSILCGVLEQTLDGRSLEGEWELSGEGQ